MTIKMNRILFIYFFIVVYIFLQTENGSILSKLVEWIVLASENLLKIRTLTKIPSFYIKKTVRKTFLLSLTHLWWRKYCLGAKFSNWRFWWIYAFCGPLNSKIPFLTVGLCAYFICISQKQSLEKTANLVFYIFVTCRCYSKLFIMIRQTICIRGHMRNFENITLYGSNFLLVHIITLNCTK